MTAPTDSDNSLKLELEACTLEDIGFGDGGIAPDLLAWCAGAIVKIALDPGRTHLVVTGDFVQSVRDRTTSEYYRENYDVERGTGIVGGKTMTLADGSIAILLHAFAFMASVDEDEDDVDDRESTVKHTTVHEAHHVAMEQAGEGTQTYGDEPWALENMLSAADSVVAEYRAELGVAEFGGFPFQDWDFIEMLKDFRTRIRAMDDEYQETRDAGALALAVGTQAVIVWRFMSYLAAFLRKADDGFQPVPPQWSEETIWRDIVGDHWESFTAILENVPSGAHRIDRGELDSSIRELAAELQSWLRYMGFHLHDTPSGPRFDIVDRRLLNQ